MAKKTTIRHLRPSVRWRETNRDKQRAELPMNSPRLARSKESRQTEEKALGKSPTTDSGPVNAD